MEAEKTLLSSLEVPLQQAFAQSLQLVQLTENALQQEDPARELRHTEMMLRCDASHIACSAVAAAPCMLVHIWHSTTVWQVVLG